MGCRCIVVGSCCTWHGASEDDGVGDAARPWRKRAAKGEGHGDDARPCGWRCGGVEEVLGLELTESTTIWRAAVGLVLTADGQGLIGGGTHGLPWTVVAAHDQPRRRGYSRFARERRKVSAMVCREDGAGVGG